MTGEFTSVYKDLALLRSELHDWITSNGIASCDMDGKFCLTNANENFKTLFGLAGRTIIRRDARKVPGVSNVIRYWLESQGNPDSQNIGTTDVNRAGKNERIFYCFVPWEDSGIQRAYTGYFLRISGESGKSPVQEDVPESADTKIQLPAPAESPGGSVRGRGL